MLVDACTRLLYREVAASNFELVKLPNFGTLGPSTVRACAESSVVGRI
jgi:hypothetical protein